MSSRRANAVCRIKEIPLLVESYCRMNGIGMGESHGSYGRFVRESVNDAADELSEVEEPIKITKIDEPAYPASDSWDKDASDIDYLIDEYINDQARRYYTNGNMPEDEEREMRDSLRAVRIFFDYWCKEDDENYAGYDEREALFIIDTDGWLCNVDWFGYGSDYSVEEWDYLVNAACEHIGVKYKGSCAPEK